MIKFKQLREKFKPYNDKRYPRCIDFYIQFRGGKGDRITSEENKKDFIKATDMIDAYIKKNKIKQKPVYSTPMEGSSAYKVGLMIDPKSVDYKNGVDLQPLYVSLSKLKTAEDHGGGWDKAVPEESFKLVDMSKKTAAIADKLAKKIGLDTDFEGGVRGIELTVKGSKKNVEKWLQSLPTESVNEGIYTKDDGGAFDGLRIAKYLAHQDGKKWKGLPYGILQGYIDDGMDMLKRNKAKAKDILSQPTPRD